MARSRATTSPSPSRRRLPPLRNASAKRRERVIRGLGEIVRPRLFPSRRLPFSPLSAGVRGRAIVGSLRYRKGAGRKRVAIDPPEAVVQGRQRVVPLQPELW